MRIRKVTIRNFRGIKEADWILPDNRFVCLVGSGDSTKTTLLDAIAFTLSSRWNIPFTDADFYNCNVDSPIVITVVIADLPSALQRDSALGMHLSGITDDNEILHDPEDGSEPCVIVRLEVTSSLEPQWTVIRLGEEDTPHIVNGGLREKFGLFRVDDRIDTHMRWGRGSALTRLTNERAGVNEAVTAAHRSARNAFFTAPPKELEQATQDVVAAAHKIGSKSFGNLRPGLDPTGNAASSNLLLHDDTVPLTSHGLGTRRLTSLAIQEKALAETSVVLIDEVEHGLEPHRLNHLLQHLKSRTVSGRGQVLMTTHSPIAVQYLSAGDISVVRSAQGATSVLSVPADLDEHQGTLRAGPAAVLAKRIIVCEGKTESGICRVLLRCWDEKRETEGAASHTALGVTHINGGGHTAPKRARSLMELGYPTLLMVDNDDRGVDALVQTAEEAGVKMVRWSVGKAIEHEIIDAFEGDALKELVELAAEIKGRESVLSSINARLTGTSPITTIDPDEWLDGTRTLEDVKAALRQAACPKKEKDKDDKSWFKREDHGEALGELLITHKGQLSDVLKKGFTRLRKFVYDEPQDAEQGDD
ncbi:hypothetical protein Afil01_28650 [Actinorhabdospora filicis]|uniref:ATPase AAA-type core domain-containing protein n=1 Tax=Actinorhabdospora filicis TaxID=1785913 RepID=A0A9W6SL91_9ACTN|nr:ATP-binding protein [Actinorhabdospora filicis]GLZ78058.1 hypothetical protein Afil01_28650 [Actinorhabdospora filicis]